MAEALSATTFVMAARLPWPDDAPAADALDALDPVALIVGGERQDCAIRKISALGATVRWAMNEAPGEEVAVELETGQRPVGTIDWVAGGEAGIRFKQPIDMLALLNRTLIAQPSERRTMPRVEIRCGVGLKWGAALEVAALRNIRRTGFRSRARLCRRGGRSFRCSSRG